MLNLFQHDAVFARHAARLGRRQYQADFALQFAAAERLLHDPVEADRGDRAHADARRRDDLVALDQHGRLERGMDAADEAAVASGAEVIVVYAPSTIPSTTSASLPFRNAGYRMNNQLHSFAAELNSRSTRFANRGFASYNRFRDFREPFSEPFPTIEIGEGGVTYTTVGHEPFSIHNLLDQDVFQITDDFSLYRGNHVFTVGTNYESFKFDNSFNLFYHGVFAAPPPFAAKLKRSRTS